MLHQIVDIGNQIYLCCFSTNWTVTVNYSQESASAKTKQEDQQSERREIIFAKWVYIYQHTASSSRNSRAMMALESKWVPFENLRLLAATSEFCHVLYHGPLPNLNICCLYFEDDLVKKNMYLGKEISTCKSYVIADTEKHFFWE